jgi:hypothetical protein
MYLIFFSRQDSTSSDFNHNFNESKVFKNDNMNGRNFGRENFQELGWIQHQGPMLKTFLRTLLTNICNRLVRLYLQSLSSLV